MAVRSQPFEVILKGFGEFANILAVDSSEVVGNKNCLHGDGIDHLILPAVGLRRNFDVQVKVEDTLVRDWNKRELVLGCHSLRKELDGLACHIEHGIDLPLLQLSQGLVRSDSDEFPGPHLGDFKEYFCSKIRAASFLSDGHDPVGQIIEIHYPLLPEQMDLFVVQWKDHSCFTRDPSQSSIGLYFGNEGQNVRLDNPQLDAGSLVDRIDVLD